MIGERLGARYHITAEIGQGGMATVYLAVDEVLSREVAVKIIHAHLARDSEFGHRFKQEASIAAKLEHPNIVKIYDYGEDASGRGFIVSEVIRGRNLHKIHLGRMKQHKGPFHPVVVAMIGQEILEGLACAHALNYVHRDVKPDNVIIDQKGHVKLADFGIAKNVSSKMTISGQYLGSPSYSSPEQVLGEDIDFRSDLFSVGVVLYEALTNHLPFVGKSITEVMNNISKGKHLSASDHDPRLPTALVSLIDRALQSRPRDRFASTGEMINALGRFLEDVGISSSRIGLEEYAADPKTFFAKLKSLPAVKRSPTRISSLEKTSASAPVRGDTEIVSSHRGELNRSTMAVNPRISLRGLTLKTTTIDRDFNPNLRRTSNHRKRERLSRTQRHTYARVTPVYIPQPTPASRQAFSGSRITALFFALAVFGFIFAWPSEPELQKKPKPDVSVSAPQEPADSPRLETTPKEKSVENPGQAPAAKLDPGKPRQIQSASKTSNDLPLRKNLTGAIKFNPSNSSPVPRKESTLKPQNSASSTPSVGRMLVKTVPGGLPILINGVLKPPLESQATSQIFELPPGRSTIAIRDVVVGDTRYQGFEKDVYVAPGQTLDLGLIRLVPMRKLRLKIEGNGVIATIDGDPYSLPSGELMLERPEGQLQLHVRAANGKSLSRTVQLFKNDVTVEASLE